MRMIKLTKKVFDGVNMLFIQLDYFLFQLHQTELGTSEVKPKEQKEKKKLSLLNAQVCYESTLPGHCSCKPKQKPLSYTASARQCLVLKKSKWFKTDFKLAHIIL